MDADALPQTRGAVLPHLAIHLDRWLSALSWSAGDDFSGGGARADDHYDIAWLTAEARNDARIDARYPSSDLKSLNHGQLYILLRSRIFPGLLLRSGSGAPIGRYLLFIVGICL